MRCLQLHQVTLLTLTANTSAALQSKSRLLIECKISPFFFDFAAPRASKSKRGIFPWFSHVPSVRMKWKNGDWRLKNALTSTSFLCVSKQKSHKSHMHTLFVSLMFVPSLLFYFPSFTISAKLQSLQFSNGMGFSYFGFISMHTWRLIECVMSYILGVEGRGG